MNTGTLRVSLAEFRRLPREAYETAAMVCVRLPDGTEAIVKNRFGHRTHHPLALLGAAGRTLLHRNPPNTRKD